MRKWKGNNNINTKANDITDDHPVRKNSKEWKWKQWTLDNMLPDYRCKAWEELDSDAFDKYFS